MTVKNYFILKRYFIHGQLTKPEDIKSYDNDINPNAILSSKIRIEIPSQANGVKSNTNVKDADNPNIYVWKIDYTTVNPIDIEFWMINWYAVTGIIIVLLLFVFYFFNSGKENFDFNVILAKLKGFFAGRNLQKKCETHIEQKAIVQSKKSKNSLKLIVITIILLTLAGTGYYFSTPKIVEITMKDVVTQINNKDFVTAKKRFDLARHINSIATRKYIKQLSDICIKKIETNDYNSVKEIIGFIEQLSPSKDTDYAKKLVAQGREKMKIGLYDKATKYFDIAVIFDSSLADIYLLKGKALLKANENCLYYCDYSEMSKLFSTAIDLDENLAEAYAYRGIISSSSEAKKDFNKAISLNSSKEATAIAYCYRAVEKFNERDFDGFLHDRSIALNLKNELTGITAYSKVFKYLEQADILMCALYDKCELDNNISTASISQTKKVYDNKPKNNITPKQMNKSVKNAPKPVKKTPNPYMDMTNIENDILN